MFNRLLGWSSFAGVSVVLLAYAITQPLAKWSIRVRLPKTTWLRYQVFDTLVFDVDHPVVVGSQRLSYGSRQRAAAVCEISEVYGMG